MYQRMTSLGCANVQEELFTRIRLDLLPWSKSGISLEMVEQVYCSYNIQSFRLQVGSQKI